jgi:DNA-directed RNA polymerase specialized sigma24 family protein
VVESWLVEGAVAARSSHQQIREPEALGGWLRTTARRECLRILAEQRRIEPLPDGVERRPDTDTTVDIERAVVDADVTRHLRTLLATLPARTFALISSVWCAGAASPRRPSGRCCCASSG